MFGSFVQLHLEMMGLHNTFISWEVKKMLQINYETN